MQNEILCIPAALCGRLQNDIHGSMQSMQGQRIHISPVSHDFGQNRGQSGCVTHGSDQDGSAARLPEVVACPPDRSVTQSAGRASQRTDRQLRQPNVTPIPRDEFRFLPFSVDLRQFAFACSDWTWSLEMFHSADRGVVW